MKLLYCIPALYNAGGMEKILTEKVNYLISLPDYEITIVTTDQKNKSVRFELDSKIKLINLNIDFDGHFSSGLIKKLYLHYKKLIDYKIRLKGIIDSNQIDICISLCGKEIDFLSKLSVKCKRIAEIHFAMNVRKQFILARHKGRFWEFLGYIRTYQLKKSVKKIDKLIVLTQDDKKQWERTHKNVIQITNPNPLTNLECSNLNNKKVISIGKLDPQKGYDMLIEAWSLVNKNNPSWELDIFGVGEQKQMLKTKIDQLNLIDKVNLKGTTRDVTNQYLNSSIYVMSSRYEGFGLVLVEAMSCGLPAISFDCEFGPGEIIANGEDGYLVKPNDILGLAEKIIFLIENPKTRSEMGRKARVNTKRFSKEVIMNKWICLFNELIIQE